MTTEQTPTSPEFDEAVRTGVWEEWSHKRHLRAQFVAGTGWSWEVERLDRQSSMGENGIAPTLGAAISAMRRAR